MEKQIRDFKQSIIVGVRLVPRPQHDSLIQSLMGFRSLIEKVVFVGELDNSVKVQALMMKLKHNVRVHHKYKKVRPAGEAAYVLIKEMLAHSTPKTQYALFLDDDAILYPDVLWEMLMKVDEKTVVVGTAEKRKAPSFDFLCSLIPIDNLTLYMLNSNVMKRMLMKVDAGGFFLIDWYFRALKYKFKSVHGVVHLYTQDKFKKWGGWEKRKWDSLYREIRRCKTIVELVQFVERRYDKWLRK